MPYPVAACRGKNTFVPSTPWYLEGGVPSANCLAAFKPIGAASLAASYTDLTGNGNDAAPGTAPTWAADTGWTFTAASSQYLIVGSGAIASAVPISFVCLFNSNDITTGYVLMSICRQNTSYEQFTLSAEGGVAGDPVYAHTTNAASSGSALTTTGYTASTWYAAAGVYAAADSRAAYIDGGSKGTNTTSKTPVSLNKTMIAARYSTATLEKFFDGKIGACAFYNTNLSDAQVLAVSNAMLAL